MPFILCGSAVSIVALLLIPVADLEQNLPFFMITLAVVLIAMASYRSPAVALMPDLTPKPLRSKGNAIINLMGTAGGIITLLMIKFLVPASVEGVQPDYRPLFIVLGIVMAGAIMSVIPIIVLFAIFQKQFIEGVRSGKSTELMNITGGYHYHTVRAEKEDILERIAEVLSEKGYIAPEI